MTTLTEEVIAELEHEARCMRARMDRLEDEIRDREEVIHKLKMQIEQFTHRISNE